MAGSAFTGREHTLRDVQSESTVIVEGEVASYRFDEREDMVFVHYTVRIERALFGEVADTLEFTLPGGELSDGRTLRVPGAPYLVPGEHVLLHGVEWGNDGTYRLNSWYHGVLREVDGVGLVGAERLPVSTWGCDVSDASPRLAGVGPPESPDDDSENPYPLRYERGPALAWSDLVATAESCLAEVRQ